MSRKARSCKTSSRGRWQVALSFSPPSSSWRRRAPNRASSVNLTASRTTSTTIGILTISIGPRNLSLALSNTGFEMAARETAFLRRVLTPWRSMYSCGGVGFSFSSCPAPAVRSRPVHCCEHKDNEKHPAPTPCSVLFAAHLRPPSLCAPQSTMQLVTLRTRLRSALSWPPVLPRA